MTQIVFLTAAGASTANASALAQLGAPRIRVLAIRGSVAWDLTDSAEGLVWSSKNPGGDERCAFRLKRKWFAGAPEISQGNRLVVTDGPEVLWQGRIEDNDRVVEQTEQIGVVAYGSGQALSDGRFQEIFVDRDFASWTVPSSQRRQNMLTTYGITDATVMPDETTLAPSLGTAFKGSWSGAPGLALSEAWYNAGEIALDSLYLAWSKNANVSYLDPLWHTQAGLSTDDLATVIDISVNLPLSAPASATVSAADDNRHFAFVQFYYETAGGADNVEYAVYWTCLAAYGRHGLPKIGDVSVGQTLPQGFVACDVVRYIAGLVQGVVARQIDATTYVIRDLKFRDPVTHEAAITKTSEVHLVDWGTFGPDDVFDRSGAGYLDWKIRDPETAHWFATRAVCEDIDLHVEMQTLFDEIDVRYQDSAGTQYVERRTSYVAALAEADPPIHRVDDLDAGLVTQADAQALGDLRLQTSSGQAPARGTIAPLAVTHYRRGKLGPWHMKADGSNIRLPDCLPARDVFSLTNSPDRKTTFPIRRVEVDAGGSFPKVTVEVDQALDAVSVAQARFAQNAIGLAA